jgi:Ca2+-binding RTX toxin-like protein
LVPSCLRRDDSLGLQVGSARGGGLIVNGKVSQTAAETGDILTRSGYSWLDSSDGRLDGVTNISFAFKSSATNTDPASFSRFTEAEINFTLSMMVSWSDVANVKFNRVGTGTLGEAAYSNNATILFSNYSAADGSAAYAYMPGSIDVASASGDVHVNINYASSRNYDYLTYGRKTIAHELGHALGLDHPGDYNGGAPTYGSNASYAEDSRQYTLMSYFDASVTGASAYMYSSTPLMDDIAAAQKLYGANMTTSTGNTVYGFNSTADRDWFAASVNGVSRTVVFCVWDAGGTDTFDFSGYSQNQTIDLRAGSFSSVGGLIGNVSIAIGVTIENAIGGSGRDFIFGNNADNRLEGGAGNDLMSGNAGNDWLIGGAGDDVLDGGTGGSDWAIYWDAPSAVFVNLSITTRQNTLGAGTDTLNNIENLFGSNFNDKLTGDTGSNFLAGGAGNDVLDGGGGGDTLIGGLGDDTYFADVAGDVVTELTNEGTDTVNASASYVLGANVENLTLTGTAAINGTGNSLGNTITGNSAANILDGGAGSDTLIGGLGDDTYIVDVAGDVVTELASEGTDTVKASLSYTLGTNVENLTLTGTAAINGTGNSLGNTITGNSAANILNGGAGNDALDGSGGADTLTGGLGDDTYIVDVAGDKVKELADEGNDTVKASLSYVLGANVENLTLTGTAAINGWGNSLNNTITGNSAANILIGGAGNDVLDGCGGADTLTGGLGDDTYIVDVAWDVVTELANEGTDTVKASLSYTLSANVENLTLTGTAAINGTGNSLNNTITGNSAANILNGGAGSDYLTGGLGGDIFIFTVVSDSISAAMDRIADFSWASGDYIDLTRIDANSALAGDQAFSFVTAFSKQAGQATLTYNAWNDTTTFRGDVNGDGVADFVLQINGQQDTSHGWVL